MALIDKLVARRGVGEATTIESLLIQEGVSEQTVTSIVEAAKADIMQAAIGGTRQGFIFGAQLMTPSGQAVVQADRRIDMEQLFQMYLTCPWASASVDVIARTATAGGVGLFCDPGKLDKDGKIPKDTPQVAALRQLLKYVNPREDMIQLLRGVFTDLLIFGDSYIEVVWVGNFPVALYSLDAPTMAVLADEHGQVTGYKQDLDGIHIANFKEHEVIHISMDAPRGAVYGIGPTQKALLSITAWVFTEACIKETFKKGDPPVIHIDHPPGTKAKDLEDFLAKYMVKNLGSKNLGTPIVSVGGATVKEISIRKVDNYLAAATQLRNEILSTYGVLPAKVGVIESGNLGGGTSEGQDKTFRVNTIIPLVSIVMEKLNYHIVQRGFGIEGWNLGFEEIDFRDSAIVENIRDMRLRNGSYTLNRYRDEIGEPPVEGGDNAVLVDRQNLVEWGDIGAMSKAQVAAIQAKGVNANIDVPGVTMKDSPSNAGGANAPDGLPPATNPTGSNQNLQNPANGPNGPNDAVQGNGPRENFLVADTLESLTKAWRHRRKAVLREADRILAETDQVSV